MAHFAKLGSNGKVIQVLTLDNKDMLNADGFEDESVGQQYLEHHNNWPAQMWIQTSYNTSRNKHNSGDNSKAFRGNYASIGMLWDDENEIFLPKKPFPSWVKDLSTASWVSPIGDAPELTDEQKTQNDSGSNDWYYKWNEDNSTWDLTDLLA
jgi:hypothetical protein